MRRVIWSSDVKNLDEWRDCIEKEIIPKFYEEMINDTLDMLRELPLKPGTIDMPLRIDVNDLDLSDIDVQDFINEHRDYVRKNVKEINKMRWEDTKSNLDVSAGGYIVIVSEYNSDLGERRYGHRITEETMIGNVLCEHTLPLLDTTFYLESNKDGLELKSRDDCYGGWCTYTYRVLKSDISDAEIKEFDRLLMKDCKPSKELLDKYTNPLGEMIKQICDVNTIVNTRFDCEEDLSKYVDSLLFADDEVPAVAEYKDGEGNTVNLRLIVTGDVHLVYKEVDYRSPSDYTQELIDLIKSGKAEENGVYIGLNNWFELVYSVCDTTGKEIAYDGEVFESDLSKMTPSELKTNLTDYAKYLFGSYEKELKKSNSAKDKTQRRETTDMEL